MSDTKPEFRQLWPMPATAASRVRVPDSLRLILAAIGLPLWLTFPTAHSADVRAYVSVTSDHVYRGVTRSDGHGAFQLGGDVSFDSGFYVGAWGSTIDIGNNVTAQRDLELNYYAGYVAELSAKWVAGASVVAYRFPGAFGNLDYSYEEVTASLNYNDTLWLEYSYSPDYYSSGADTHNVELYGEWPLAGEFSLGAGIGHYDVSEFSGRSYTYWQLGVSRPIGRVGLDLRFHDTNRSVPRVSNPERAEARVSLSARLQF